MIKVYVSSSLSYNYLAAYGHFIYTKDESFVTDINKRITSIYSLRRNISSPRHLFVEFDGKHDPEMVISGVIIDERGMIREEVERILKKEYCSCVVLFCEKMGEGISPKELDEMHPCAYKCLNKGKLVSELFFLYNLERM